MKENVTILSIDDDPQIRFALGELFKFQGWRAVSASDVASGLEVFRRYSPDIVLIDYHMPSVSGIEGVKLLRKQSASVPIIVFTIDESQTVADTFLAAGASDFALKPILSQGARYRQPHQAAPAPCGTEPTGAGGLQGHQRWHAGHHHEFPFRSERLCDRKRDRRRDRPCVSDGLSLFAASGAG